MNDLAVREALVFGGAIAGAVWGYFLGKALERRRFAREIRPSLEALEQWALEVCDGLEGLERSLGGPPGPDGPAVHARADEAVGSRHEGIPALRPLRTPLRTAP